MDVKFFLNASLPSHNPTFDVTEVARSLMEQSKRVRFNIHGDNSTDTDYSSNGKTRLTSVSLFHSAPWCNFLFFFFGACVYI